jgi:hypothetical protein
MLSGNAFAQADLQSAKLSGTTDSYLSVSSIFSPFRSSDK